MSEEPSRRRREGKHVREVAIFEKAQKAFGLDTAARGHHVVYRTNESNRCPGCGRSQWYIGRLTAECGFCGTAVSLAEIKMSAARRIEEAKPIKRRRGLTTRKAEPRAVTGDERREHARIKTPGRALQLMIDGSPHSFALENVSAGGAMARNPLGLIPGATLHVRFEGGILVPAVVKWAEGDFVGLAFTAQQLLDSTKL
jgi:hypothetical protein